MYHLRHLTRDGSFTLWDEHFKCILMLLVEIIAGEASAEIRSSALRTLKEIW
jgi:CLIP-associating protein 1/2